MRCFNPIVGVYLIDSLSSGGAQRQFVELVKGLDRKLVTPLVVVYHDLPFFYTELLDAGISVTLLPKKDKIGVSFIKQFIPFLREVKADYIHSFLDTPNFYARVIKMFRIVRVVITSERSVLIGQSKFLSILEKITWRFSDHIIANAHGVKKVLVEKIGVSSDRVSVIHNGTQIPSMELNSLQEANNITKKLGCGIENYFIIGLIGRLSKEKNHSILLDAVKIIRDHDPNMEMIVAFWGGEPDKIYKRILVEKIKSLGLNRKVHFCGVHNNICCVYEACDLVVLPSLWEGFPNVLLEAMGMGKVVIASDIVDNALIIKDGYNGFLLPPDDPKLWSDKIMEVYHMSEAFRIVLEEQATLTITKKFTLKKMIEETMAVYKRMNLC